jgi:opacity protein-like surface antigen
MRYTGEKLSAGLIVKTPHVLKQTTDVKLASVNMRNGNIELDETETIYWDDNLTELDMPFIIGGGVGYQVTENLLLAMDAEYRAFSGGEVNVRDSIRLNPGEKDTEFFTTTDPQWNNVFTVRAGGEYRWHTGSTVFPLVPFRAGFSYVPIPKPNVTGEVIFDTTQAAINYEPDLRTEGTAAVGFGLGAGLHWDQIHLDFAYNYRKLDREDTKRIVESNPYFRSETSTTDHVINVTFTGFF